VNLEVVGNCGTFAEVLRSASDTDSQEKARGQNLICRNAWKRIETPRNRILVSFFSATVCSSDLHNEFRDKKETNEDTEVRQHKR
jgi:hypothetical protein